jgi:hypothetical protein
MAHPASHNAQTDTSAADLRILHPHTHTLARYQPRVHRNPFCDRACCDACCPFSYGTLLSTTSGVNGFRAHVHYNASNV